MFASNKAASYTAGAVLLVVVYFGEAYFPIYWDNIELKQVARSWVSASRADDERTTERTRKQFDGNVRNLGIVLPPEACTMTRVGDDGAKVECTYQRDVEFLFVNKKRPIRFHWVVHQRYNNM